MKIRKGFVSNSSSSSFIVIGDGPLKELKIDGTVIIGQHGETEFGWENTVYDGVWSRINFAYLQAVDRSEWLEMLEDILKEHLGCTEIVYLINTSYDEKPDSEHGPYVRGYIDHQSAACEGSNTEMFESKEKLKQFLFCADSYIQGGNDN